MNLFIRIILTGCWKFLTGAGNTKPLGKQWGFKRRGLGIILRATNRRCLKQTLQKHTNTATTTVWKSVIAEIFTATPSGKFPWLIMFLPVAEFPYSSSGINASDLNADNPGERRGLCAVVDSRSCLCSLPEEQQFKQRIHCFKMGQQDKGFSYPSL